MPDPHKTPYLRIETDGTPETTRVFIGGVPAPAFTQSFRFTAGAHWLREGGVGYDLPVLEMKVAALGGDWQADPYQSAPSEWVITSSGPTDNRIFHKGVDITRDLFIMTVDLGCDVDGRTYCEIERHIPNGAGGVVLRRVETDERPMPVIAREILFNYQAPKKTA